MPTCCEYGPTFSCAYRYKLLLGLPRVRHAQTTVRERAPMKQATRRRRTPGFVVHQPRDLVVLLQRSTVELKIYRNRHPLHPFIG
jgi:hypothetical protein